MITGVAKQRLFAVALLVTSLLGAVAYLVLPESAYFLALVALSLLLVIIIWPATGLALLIFTLPVETVAIFFRTGDFRTNYPLYLFPLLCTYFSLLLHLRPEGAGGRSRLFRFDTPVHFLAAGLLLAESVALLWAPDTVFGLHHVLGLVINLMIFHLVYVTVPEAGGLSRLNGLLIASGFMAALFVFGSAYYDEIYRHFFSKDFGYQYGILKFGGRPSGLGGVDQTAGFLAGCVFLGVPTLIHARGRGARLRCLSAVAVIFLAMLFTASRGALIGFLAGACAFMLLHVRGRRRFIVNTALLGVVVGFSILLVKPGLVDRVLVGFGYQGTLYFSDAKGAQPAGEEAELVSTGMTARIKWWKMGLQAMADHPLKFLAGLGPGGFVFYSKAPEVHSFWLSFFFDVGLIGLVILIFASVMLAAAIRRAFAGVAAGSPRSTLLLAVVSMLIAEVCVHGLVEFELTSMIGRFPWLFLALATIVVAVQEGNGELDG